MSILPKKNELGFFEIRLESIGGLGANLAGKMLADDATFVMNRGDGGMASEWALPLVPLYVDINLLCLNMIMKAI